MPKTLSPCPVVEDAIRDNMTPEGVATLIAYLQPAVMRPRSEQMSVPARSALQEVEWLHDVLMRMLGVQAFNDLCEELGL